jgi:tellurite resistance protein TerC
MFIGAKMLLEGFFHIPIIASLGVVAAVLLSSILASLRWPREVRQPLPGAGDSDRNQSGDIS